LNPCLRHFSYGLLKPEFLLHHADKIGFTGGQSVKDTLVADEQLGELFGFQGKRNPVGDVGLNEVVDPRVAQRIV
jgi:hypothetical protein